MSRPFYEYRLFYKYTDFVFNISAFVKWASIMGFVSYIIYKALDIFIGIDTEVFGGSLELW